MSARKAPAKKAAPVTAEPSGPEPLPPLVEPVPVRGAVDDAVTVRVAPELVERLRRDGGVVFQGPCRVWLSPEEDVLNVERLTAAQARGLAPDEPPGEPTEP